jgi:uncharacterized protein with FMN-binding domain
MQRAPIVLAATAAGLAFTLGFNAHTKTPATTATVAATTTPATPSASSSSKTSSSSSSSSSSSASKKASSSSATKTVTGDAVGTIYGNVQLKVTISGGKITDVTPVQLPSNDPKSIEIGQYAAPLLRRSALAKQSANIDAVSGATYTSAGYKAALQSALDKAGFQSSSAATA